MQDFYASYGLLPVPGALPDMKAQSGDYVELQNIYKTKARHDLAKVVQSVRMVEHELQRHSSIDEKEIEAFCKNAAFIKLIKGQPLRPPMPLNLEERREIKKKLYLELQNENSLLPIHAAFTIYDLIMSAAPLPPSADTDASPNTLTDLHARTREHITNETHLSHHLATFWDSLSGSSEIDLCNAKIKTHLTELTRAKGGELHNISALTGGMVAQEIIKVISKQYIPIDNTCVFDGVGSKTEVFRGP